MRYFATKSQRREVAQRKNLSEPWCPGVFVVKNILATKAQRHEAAQRKNLSEPWCPCVLVAKNLATKAQRHEAAQRNLVNLSALVSSWRKTNKNENKHIHR